MPLFEQAAAETAACVHDEKGEHNTYGVGIDY